MSKAHSKNYWGCGSQKFQEGLSSHSKQEKRRADAPLVRRKKQAYAQIVALRLCPWESHLDPYLFSEVLIVCNQ